jgi:RNA polymerase sigma factor (sigma-70 family)
MKQTTPPSDYKKLSDEELIYRYVHRNEHIAITYIYERYAHLVLGICMKYVKSAEAARNLSMQLFISMLEDIKKTEIDEFKPWLYAYTKKYCAAKGNAENKLSDNIKTTKTGTEFVLDNNEWYSHLSEEHLTENIEKAVQLLKPEYRLCIEMFYLQGLTYEEIAKKTNYKVSQVRTYLQAGRKQLKEKLEEGA